MLRNWARSESWRPLRVVRPADEDELADVLAMADRADLPVRPLGAGHSFTPLAATDGITLLTDRMSGLLSVDTRSGLVTLGAGTRLRDVPGLLGPHSLALENLGDIDSQTIAGAISTGTHGTGARFAGLAGQVRGLRLVLADGRIVDCSPSLRPELFQAARIGLGAFGVLTAVTVQCVPAFLLTADERPESLADVLRNFDELVESADHVEFYWFPHTTTALVKRNHRLPPGATRDPLPRLDSLVEDELLANGLFAVTCLAGWAAPILVPGVNRIAAHLVGTRHYTDDSQAVFTSPRRVRFREMEYSIDRDALPLAVSDIRSLIARRGWRISFPLEIRVAAADDVWLSTAYGRPSAYIAVHRYLRDPFAEYFLAVEQILLGYGGRPHWGKLHSLGALQLRQLYPEFDRTVAVRDEVDPTHRFGNSYLRRVLGTPPGVPPRN